MAGSNVAKVVKDAVDQHSQDLEGQLKADVIAYLGQILFGYDEHLRNAVELFVPIRRKLAILLDTVGGVVEVVERMVDIVRYHYSEVVFLIPDRAMSAGTVFAMSGDAIMMDYYSRLGPIDPQIEKDGKLVPALSYLVQYRRLLKRAKDGDLSNAEFALLAKFDLAEIHQYEQARNLTRTLLRKWLATYKFKNWNRTAERGIAVDDELGQKRAEEIADALSDNELWHSHGRGISAETLKRELNLVIDDYGGDTPLQGSIRAYHQLLRDFAIAEKLNVFVHNRKFF